MRIVTESRDEEDVSGVRRGMTGGGKGMFYRVYLYMYKVRRKEQGATTIYRATLRTFTG